MILLRNDIHFVNDVCPVGASEGKILYHFCLKAKISLAARQYHVPEFVGRIPVVSTLDEIDEPTLVRILTEPKNSIISQYTELFKMDGVALSFAPDALAEIAKKAIALKVGARGLRAIVAFSNCW